MFLRMIQVPRAGAGSWQTRPQQTSTTHCMLYWARAAQLGGQPPLPQICCAACSRLQAASFGEELQRRVI
jgi:hypothetical protein